MKPFRGKKMAAQTISHDFKTFSKDIKLSHSFFSFPFVGASLIIAESKIGLTTLALLIFSMTCARSFAMGMNRYFDRAMDLKNPRTLGRAIPANKITSTSLLYFSLMFGGLFVLSSLFYNKVTFLCSVPLLFILGAYSFTKKWTWLCHLYLGFCLALSPIAASLALGGEVPLTSYLIALALLFWVSGFDIIYATQDYAFDKKERVHSIPSFFGIKKALRISQLLFVLMMISLGALSYFSNLGFFYNTGLLVISCILFYEHYSLSKKKVFNQIDPIFFTANAWISVIFLFFVILEFYT